MSRTLEDPAEIEKAEATVNLIAPKAISICAEQWRIPGAGSTSRKTCLLRGQGNSPSLVLRSDPLVTEPQRMTTHIPPSRNPSHLPTRSVHAAVINLLDPPRCSLHHFQAKKPSKPQCPTTPRCAHPLRQTRFCATNPQLQGHPHYRSMKRKNTHSSHLPTSRTAIPSAASSFPPTCAPPSSPSPPKTRATTSKPAACFAAP